jgi:hypothetical protein
LLVEESSAKDGESTIFRGEDASKGVSWWSVSFR